MATTVHVKNIGADTDEQQIREFFSFCGTIEDLNVTEDGDTKSATVIFAKPNAAKTALLLTDTVLNGVKISVTGDNSDESFKHNEERDSDEITQEEKPRTRILAEYLAHGYVVGDAALTKAIDLDQRHGVSSRFLSTLQNLDAKFHATDRAKTADQSYGITQRTNSLLTGIGSYFEKATNTPTGKRIVKFYTDGQKQVTDIHNEARRLADLKKVEHGGSAYKAAGLEKIFGKEETTTPASTSAHTTATPATAAGADANVPPKA